MALILNEQDKYEPITIKLTKEATPIAYANKIAELVEQGAYPSVEVAEECNPEFEIVCEIYYEKNNGLFAVEADAIESYAEIYSPYNGTEYQYPEDL